MSKSPEKEEIQINDQESAFEMIELVCGELDQLTRAFKVIESVCDELNKEVEGETKGSGPFILH